MKSFKEFTKTRDFDKIIQNLNSDTKIYLIFDEQMTGKFKQEVQNKAYQSQYQRLLMVENTKHKQEQNSSIDQLLKGEFNGLKQRMRGLGSQELVKEFSQGLLNLYFCIISLEYFQFNSQETFDWNHFENKVLTKESIGSEKYKF